LAELPRLQQDLAKVPRSALVVIEADERVAYEDVKKLIDTLGLAGMDRVAFRGEEPDKPKGVTL
jgi:biopolymer transport protein ExbD